MAKFWVKTEFTDENGKHEVGEELELPTESDVQKSEVDRLLDWGIISRNEIKAIEDSTEGSSSRRRRSS
jgi:hypothetical protein